MAAIPTTTIIITAILATGSSDSSMSLIERAASAHSRLFFVYIVVLVLVVVSSVFVWTSGNKLQDATRADADARIARIKSESEVAKRESDEKIAALNKEAERLRLNAEAARLDIAQANAGAAEATERAALANKATEELRAANLALQRIMRPRILYGNCEGAEDLRKFKGMQVVIFVIPSDSEAFAFASSIASVLADAGWKPDVRFVTQVFDGVRVFGGEFPEGDVLHFESKEETWMAAHALARCLTSNFSATETGSNFPVMHLDDRILPASTKTFSRPAGVVAITVGMKPTTENLLMLEHMKNAFSSPAPSPTPNNP